MPFFVQEPNEPKRKEPPTNLAVTVHLLPPFFCVRVLRSIPFYEGFLRRDEDVVFAAAFGWLDYPEGADGGYGHVVWGAFNAKSLDFYRCRVQPLSFGDWERLVDALRYALDVFAPFGVLHPIVPSLNRAFRLKRLLGAFRPL